MPAHTNLYSQWAQEMRRSGLLRAGERVGVAVSGGPDSVLLLEFANALVGKMGLVVSAVHFNHHLRGTESDADECFVRELAGRLGVAFLRGEADVARVAREKRRNLEATARELRYRFFFSLIHRGRLDKIATAHTANDQAETVLLRLLRGTGTRGLGGIYPSLEGRIVRPFLSLTRAQVEQELARRGLEFRVDSTNLQGRFRRNKVRRELLPWLEREFNTETAPLLVELAQRARDDEEYLEHQARERARPWRVRENEEERIPVRPLAEFPPALVGRVLRQMILAARGSLAGVSHRHIEALRHLATGAQSGRWMVLPGNLIAHRDFEWLVIGKAMAQPTGSDFSFAITPPAVVAVPQLGLTLQFKIVGQAEVGRAYNGQEVGWLDPLKFAGELRLRNWRAGDRFCPLGCRKAQKLKELFRQRRIPAGQRKVWPVLESGNEIVWVRGFPVAASVAASPEAGRVMMVLESAGAPIARRGGSR
jgi:tRNA(Ile)-lysidine synthase